MAWTLSRTDTFNRANSTLNGSTMSDGIGVWSGDTNWTVASNQGKATAAGTVVDSSATTTDCKVEFTYISGTEFGAAFRYTVASQNGYITYLASGVTRIYKVAGGGLTLLATGGIGVSANDVLAVTVEGSTITTYVNGVQDSQVTDSTYASGNAGLNAGIANGICDSWNLYIPASSGSSGDSSWTPSGVRTSAFRGKEV